MADLIQDGDLLPEGWLAPRKEFFLEDLAGKKHCFAFESERQQITNMIYSKTEQNGPRTSERFVASCRICHAVIHPHPDSLRLHAWQHLFPTVPWNAPRLEY
jgi:hypothetical protein